MSIANHPKRRFRSSGAVCGVGHIALRWSASLGTSRFYRHSTPLECEDSSIIKYPVDMIYRVGSIKFLSRTHVIHY